MDWKMTIRDIIKQVGYIRLVLLLICGIFLIIVSLPEKKNEMEENSLSNQIRSYDTDENDIYVEKMEERLAGILEMIDGAGNVEVMITLSASSETVVNKDFSSEESIAKEGENQKETENSVRKEETVFVEEDGNSRPYVIKTMEPVIEGVMIVMEGGGNENISAAVTEAVQALFHVEAHKIKVLKMEDGS